MTTADTQSIDAVPGARVYAVLHGDIHIRNGAPVYQFEPARLQPRALHSGTARNRPSWLLAAENQVVGFSGRGEELEALSRWRDSSRPGVSVQLIDGPGGQGKSRLAAEFASRSAASGWSVWAAYHMSDTSGQPVVALGEPGAQLLLLVDYAERWPLDDLVLMLGNAALRRPERVRVLLVARTADVWWPALRDAVDAFVADGGGTLRLQPLAGAVVDRRALFVAAYRSFAELFGVPPVPVSTPDDRTLRDYDLVLTTHMAALAAVDARQRGVSPPADPVGLSRYLLDREHDFWQTRYDHGRDMVADPVVMGQLVHTAILTRPVLPAQGESIVVQLGITPAESASRALRDHVACYQPAEQTRGTVLEPLYPDRLGEDFLALHSPGHDIDDYAPDDWSQDVPAKLLDHDPSTAPMYARKAIASLIEVARRWRHVAERQLHPLLRDRPELAVWAGGAALVSLASIPAADMAVLAAIEALLPPDRSVDLDVGIAAVVERLTAYRLTRTQNPAERADLHHELARRLARAGRHSAAEAALEEAVRLRRPLAQIDPRRGGPPLAAVLCDLSIARNKLARTDEALEAADEAVRIHADLAAAGIPDDKVGMALAKSALAARLHSRGRRRDAVVVAGEALELYRVLAEGDPRYLPRVAATLNNLGVWLSDLGDVEKGLQYADEAQQVYRHLATSQPETYLPDLAATLTNQAVRLSEIGRWDKGRIAAEESVAAFRSLAEANPAYEADLALALNNFGVRLAEVGDTTRALEMTQQSLSLRRRHYADNPLVTEPALAATLTNLGNRLSALARHPEALAPTAEAVALYRRLAERNPDAFEPLLSAALTSLAVRLARTEQNAESVTAAQESVAILRRLVGHDAAAFEPGLAAALTTLGARLASVDRAEDAIAATHEAVAIHRRLAAANPAGFRPALAMSLLNLSADLKDAGRLPEALSAAAESVEIRCALAAETPRRFTADLARGLWRLGTTRASTADTTELRTARSELIEALALYQQLSVEHPSVHADDLTGVKLALDDVERRIAAPDSR